MLGPAEGRGGFTGSAGGASNVPGNFPSSHKDIGVVYVGTGVSF